MASRALSTIVKKASGKIIDVKANKPFKTKRRLKKLFKKGTVEFRMVKGFTKSKASYIKTLGKLDNAARVKNVDEVKKASRRLKTLKGRTTRFHRGVLDIRKRPSNRVKRTTTRFATGAAIGTVTRGAGTGAVLAIGGPAAAIGSFAGGKFVAKREERSRSKAVKKSWKTRRRKYGKDGRR